MASLWKPGRDHAFERMRGWFILLDLSHLMNLLWNVVYVLRRVKKLKCKLQKICCSPHFRSVFVCCKLIGGLLFLAVFLYSTILRVSSHASNTQVKKLKVLLYFSFILVKNPLFGIFSFHVSIICSIGCKT